MQELIQEIRRNPRLRLGAWAILLILLSYAAMFGDDLLAKQRQEYIAATKQLSERQALLEQGYWKERLATANERLAQWYGMLWSAETEGIASASFLAWLKRKCEEAGLADSAIQMLPVTEVMIGRPLWKVSAEVKGGMELKKLEALLRELDTAAPLALVEKLKMRKVSRFTYEMVVTGYFIAPQAATSARDRQ